MQCQIRNPYIILNNTEFMAKKSDEQKNNFQFNDQSKIIAAVVIIILFTFGFFYIQSQNSAQKTETQATATEASGQKPEAGSPQPETIGLPSSGERQAAGVSYTYPPSNHFGIVNAKQDYAALAEIGITWDRPYPGPFNWQKIGFDKYGWDAADEYVKAAQEHGFNTLGIIWPYNQIDQDSCYKGETEIEFGELSRDLATRRRKPCSIDAYKEFARSVVERYDADGVGDMPGLKYGIKHWEIASEPEVQYREQGKVFFQGDGKSYSELLKASYEAIKSADPDAKVLHGGISKDGIGTNFWVDVFARAGNYFDIANYHCSDCEDTVKIQEFKNFLAQNNINKPVWLTSVSFSGVSDKEQSKKLFAGYLHALGKNADKVFYERWNEALGGKLALANIIQLPDVKRPAYFTLRALIAKLDNYSSAKEVSDGHYEFAISEKTIHAFMKAMDLPKGLQGDVIQLDYNGTVRKEKMFNVVSADLPAVIEKV